jgi:hypothetical protein
MDKHKLLDTLKALKPYFRDPKFSPDSLINLVAEKVLSLNGSAPLPTIVPGNNSIMETTNYGLLKTIKSNRAVNDQHVKKIMDSVQKKNLLHIRPALVNEDMVLIDGQHRHEACRRMKIPIPFVVSQGLTKDDIRFLNSAQKNWSFMDFINYYATEGHSGFQEFAELAKEFPRIQPSTLIKIVSYDQRKNDIREGVIYVGQIKRGKKVCQAIYRLNDFWKRKVEYNFVFSGAFVTAMDKCFRTNDFEFARLYDQIEKNPDLFRKYTSRNEYLKSLDLIYNLKQKTKLVLAPASLI